jgi:hypothetical protein
MLKVRACTLSAYRSQLTESQAFSREIALRAHQTTLVEAPLMSKKLAPILAALLLFSVPNTASAAGGGVALDPAQLDAKTRAELRAEIDKAKTTVPELFKQVDDVAAHAKELDANARAQGIPLTMHFKPLGNRAFYPMMELLVFDAHAPKGGLPSSAETALRLGLIEAIGSIRDAHAVPVFAKIVDTTKDGDTLRASAEGLARIGNDDAVSSLIAAAQKSRPAEGSSANERAILTGMKDCRREAAARYLAKRLRDPATTAELAIVLTKSLGGVGNAWAWKTIASFTNEQSATRSIAAAALIDTFSKWVGDHDAREAAIKALLLVDDPSTPSLIATARKSAPAESHAAFDDLDRRFATNPAR